VKRRESNDAARHTGDAAAMPTFELLCAESVADAVLGRDGDVARRLRAETGASVELLVPPPTSLFAFEPEDAFVARRVPPDRGRDVAVRVSCDDALSTAFSCPARTCLFRLHARIDAVARDETRAVVSQRANRASGLFPAFEALEASGASPGDFFDVQRESFFRVLAPRGACDYRSVRERTGASVRVSLYALRANTDLVVIDHHASDAACHVEAMRRVVEALGTFQSGTKRTFGRARDANQDDSLRGGGHLPPHHPPLPLHVPHAQSTRNVAGRAFERYGPIPPPPPRRARPPRDARPPRSSRRARTSDGDRSSLEHHSSTTLDSEVERRRRRSCDASADESEKSVVVHLPVPTSLVRFVVGRGGATIQRVRAESGAKVKLHDCAPGAATRFLELGGAIDKVQAARALVVRCLERVVLPPEDDQGF
jgi:hypothetical protein